MDPYKDFTKRFSVLAKKHPDIVTIALQRGLWTHTKNALQFFDSLTNGWIDYSHNKVLVKLFSHALVSSEIGHASALELIKRDISELQKKYKLDEK